MIPGSFDKSKKQRGKSTFGSSRTKVKPVLDVPGPGMYSIDKKYDSHSFGFGTSQRPQLGASKERVPGPGQYTDKSKRIGSACTIR